MKLLVAGLSHHTAPVEVRERLAFEENSLPLALDSLRKRPGFHEGLILSTCNRVEVAVTTEDHGDAEASVDQFLAEARNVEQQWVSPYLYHYNGPDAIRHLFRVASSLDSMVVGEPQILGQLKNAYALAKQHGAVNGFLDLVMSRAFNVAKRIRTETEIGSSAVSVSYAAVELARDIFGALNECRVLLLGAGKMAESAARHLRRAGVQSITVTNRTRARADAIAEEFQGQVVAYDEFLNALPGIDIVITSSAAPHYVLTKEQMRLVMNRRRNRPMFLIDIAVPRNIEPAANTLDGVFLYDIDDLDKVVKTNVQGRLQVAQEAEAIISEEVERMVLRLKTREVTPTIVSLQKHLEQLCLAEIERQHGKLGDLTSEQKEAVDAIARGIINKIAHGPITELRRNAQGVEGSHVIDTIRRMFRLGDE